MNDKFVEARVQSADRCERRLRETHPRSVTDYPSEFDRADVLVINLVRLLEVCIDLAKHMASSQGLGPAANARDAR